MKFVEAETHYGRLRIAKVTAEYPHSEGEYVYTEECLLVIAENSDDLPHEFLIRNDTLLSETELTNSQVAELLVKNAFDENDYVTEFEINNNGTVKLTSQTFKDPDGGYWTDNEPHITEKMSSFEICFDDDTKPKRAYKGKSLLENLSDYVVIDLETTDRNIYACDIIELSAVRVRNNDITEKYSTLVRPPVHIPQDVVELTGITDEMVSDKPAIDEVLEEYIDFLGDDILLGHNIASFDINILYDKYEQLFGKTLSNDFLDTNRYSRHCDIHTANHQLITLADYYNIVNEHAHRSLSDCITNHYVYQRLKETFSPKHKPKSDRSCSPRFKPKTSAETKALRELQEALKNSVDNNKLTAEYIYALKDWLEEHSEFKDKFPFNEIYNSIEAVISDGIIDNEEAEYLKELFIIVLDPVSSQEHTDEAIDLKDKKICLTGEFVRGTRPEIKELLESKGAVIVRNVSSKTDYVVVGDIGNENWKFGNYGDKVQKAMDYQKKGKSVEIIKESDFFAKIGE